MSRQNSVWQELEGSGKLSPGTLAYVGQRARNSFYDFVLDRFRESQMTQAELARRLGKSPPQVNRTLASPANWTIVTAAQLLAAISNEELRPQGVSWVGRVARNREQSDNLKNRIPAPDEQTPTGSDASVQMLDRSKILEYTA